MNSKLDILLFPPTQNEKVAQNNSKSALQETNTKVSPATLLQPFTRWWLPQSQLLIAGGARFWTWGLGHAKHTLYHWATPPYFRPVEEKLMAYLSASVSRPWNYYHKDCLHTVPLLPETPLFHSLSQLHEKKGNFMLGRKALFLVSIHICHPTKGE